MDSEYNLTNEITNEIIDHGYKMQAEIKELQDRSVPYIVFESTVARFERTIKRLVIAIITAIIILFVSNMAWLYAWNLYDYESANIVVDGESKGNANYIGASGVINNGEGSSEETSPQEEER